MYTFSELKSNIATLVQRSGDTSYISDIGVWVNLSIQNLYNSYDYYDELKNVHNFTTVDGTARYYMPSDFEKPLRMYDITNDKKITWRTYEGYFDGNIANIADANESDADQVYFTEVVGVKVQVATTGDTVQAKSSSTSDTTQIVRVEGYLDSGLTIIGYDNITLNGTTAATATSANTFYKILNVSKSADTVGYVTVENSSGTDLTTLDSVQRVSRHKAFDLGRIPDDSTTSMRVLYKKKFRKLVNDNDYPFIECDDYIIYNATALSLQQNKETLERAVMFEKKAQEAKNFILLNQNTKLGPDYQHKMVSNITLAHRA